MGDRPTAWAQQMQRLHGPTRPSLAARLLQWFVALALVCGIAFCIVLLVN